MGSNKGLKKCDAFGQSVTLNYKGKSQYQTLFGGFVTIIVVMSFLALMGWRIANFILLPDATSS